MLDLASFLLPSYLLATPFYYGIKIRLIGIVSYKLTPPRGCSSFARSLALLGSDEQVWIFVYEAKTDERNATAAIGEGKESSRCKHVVSFLRKWKGVTSSSKEFFGNIAVHGKGTYREEGACFTTLHSFITTDTIVHTSYIYVCV